MKKTVYSFFEKTIIDNIDFEGYDLDNNVPLYNKVQTLYIVFKKEYVHQNNQHQNEVFLFSEWLRGLPSVLTVPFYNWEILENGLQYAQENDDKNLRIQVRKEDKFLEDYWINLAKAFFTLKENL